MDDLRARGTVEVRCSIEGCGWAWWCDPLDPRLDGRKLFCGVIHSSVDGSPISEPEPIPDPLEADRPS